MSSARRSRAMLYAYMPVLGNIGRLVTCREPGGQGAVHAIAGGAIAWREGRITWVGKQKQLPTRHDDGQRWDAQGQLVVPGLVDAHTHLCFAGWRADDFVAR